MRAFGVLLWVGSAFFLLGAFAMDTTVATESGSRVHNIGLMRHQENALLLGIGFLITGGIFFAMGGKKNPPATTSSQTGTEETKKCPYCAEAIKLDAIVCRFCGRDLPTSSAISSSDPHAPSQKNERPVILHPDTLRSLSSMGITVERGIYSGWKITYSSGEVANIPSDDELIKLTNDLAANRSA